MLKPKELIAHFLNGQNISDILRTANKLTQNNQQIIEMSYDIQSGGYTKAMKNAEYASNRDRHSVEIAKIIRSLSAPSTILEAGVGEATVFSGVIERLNDEVEAYGFDISWSRLALAHRWLKSKNINNTQLCTGELLAMPYSDSSIDVVYTSQSIEPNGGNEESILKELYRVTRQYLILVEPDYALANDAAKQHMDSHGYCKDLYKTAKYLGYNVIKHERFPVISNPLNPISFTIISKLTDEKMPDSIIACPKYKTPLIKKGEAYFSEDALVAYPILGGIACLRTENGIFASQYLSS